MISSPYLFNNIKKSLFDALEEGFTKGVFPGAAGGVLIDRPSIKDNIVMTYGFTDEKRTNKVKNVTFYDLASLTKPLVTVLSLLILLERGVISFGTKIDELLQREVPEEKKQITLLDLMMHRTGLPAYKPFFENLRKFYDQNSRKNKIIELILNERLNNKIGTISNYSDLNFIILGYAIETLTKKRLDIFWKENISEPISVEKKLMFSPKSNKIPEYLLAPTEKCPWTGKMLAGIVHDENCRVLGEVAGHAGLFGTIDGVLLLCGQLIREWRGEEKKLFYSDVLKNIFKREKNTGSCYGFDIPSENESSSGRFFSFQTVGHLGFTGTSFWIDLEKGISIVLLTNRVHPSRDNNKIKQFRPAFHDRVMKEILDVLK